ncbi:hypothetical protein QJQ45_023255 [Haematococcus lacustris]|nr:hypothetical protein QJQ45_023255 [Haematococcus lacustris]
MDSFLDRVRSAFTAEGKGAVRGFPDWTASAEDKARSCLICDSVFGSIVRRHQCRLCGKAICQECSRGSLPAFRDSQEMLRACDYCECTSITSSRTVANLIRNTRAGFHMRKLSGTTTQFACKSPAFPAVSGYTAADPLQPACKQQQLATPAVFIKRSHGSQASPAGHHPSWRMGKRLHRQVPGDLTWEVPPDLDPEFGTNAQDRAARAATLHAAAPTPQQQPAAPGYPAGLAGTRGWASSSMDEQELGQVAQLGLPAELPLQTSLDTDPWLTGYSTPGAAAAAVAAVGQFDPGLLGLEPELLGAGGHTGNSGGSGGSGAAYSSLVSRGRSLELALDAAGTAAGAGQQQQQQAWQQWQGQQERHWRRPQAMRLHLLLPALVLGEQGGRQLRVWELNRGLLAEAAQEHLARVVVQLLSSEAVAEPQVWCPLVTRLALEAVSAVDPFKALTYKEPWVAGKEVKVEPPCIISPDPGQYIKVKRLIDVGRPEDSSVVSAVVTKRNVMHKRMAMRKIKPKVLLLGGALEYQQGRAAQLATIEALVGQEQDLLLAAVERIANLKPDLVLVEKSVARLAQEELRSRNISVVQEVKASLMERLSRAMRCPIIRSLELVGPLSTCGSCTYFMVEPLNPAPSPPPGLLPLDPPGGLQPTTPRPTSSTLPPSPAAGPCPQLGGGATTRPAISGLQQGSSTTGAAPPWGPPPPASLMSFGYPEPKGATILLRGGGAQQLSAVKSVLKFAVLAAWAHR